MRFFVSCAAALLLAVVLLAACSSNDKQTAAQRNANAAGQQMPQTPPDGIPRITVTDLKAAVDAGTVLIVDTRSPEAYNADHIKGSINIPESSNLDAHMSQLPADKKIVAYCS
jgi:Rhodanese-related sulfurtransferase